MGATTAPRGSTIGLGRRWLLGVALAATLGAFVFAAWSFAWPSAAARGEYSIGPVDGFAPGSVTPYLLDDGRLRRLAVAETYDRRPPGYPAIGTDLVYVVRFPNGTVSVLSGAAPFRDSSIIWYQLDEWASDGGEWTGLFAEGRRGARWTIDGTRVFGPAPRGMDRYTFRIRADGVLVVDLAELSESMTGPLLLNSYDVTADDWSTSGWSPRLETRPFASGTPLPAATPVPGR